MTEIEPNKELKAAIIRAIDVLKKEKYITINCKPHSKVVDCILSELSTLGSSKLGEVTQIAGRSIDPLTVVALLAKGENPKLEEPKPAESVLISKMAEQYALHAAKLDKVSKNSQYELLESQYSGVLHIRRLAWEIEEAFGVAIYGKNNTLQFYGYPNSIRTCKMTLDVLIDQIKNELEFYNDDEEKEQFCQEFGHKLNLKKIITDEEMNNIKKKYRTEICSVSKIVDRVDVEQRIAEKAKIFAEKVASSRGDILA